MTNSENKPNSLYRTEDGCIRAALMEFDDRLSIAAEKVKFDVELQEFRSETAWYSPKQAASLISVLQRCLENLPDKHDDSDESAPCLDSTPTDLEPTNKAERLLH